MISWQSGITIASVETMTLKLDKRHIEKLKAHAQATGRSQAAVVRELIDRHLARSRPSLHDQAKDVCGSVSGSRDLSTRPLAGYGRD